MMRTRLCCALIALMLAACSGKTPDQKLAKAIDPAASWVASLQLTAECWLRNQVPSAFVRESIESAQKALQKAEDAVNQSRADEKIRDAVSQQLRFARDAAGELNGATERGDRTAAVRARARLHDAYQKLHEIEEREEQ